MMGKKPMSKIQVRVRSYDTEWNSNKQETRFYIEYAVQDTTYGVPVWQPYGERGYREEEKARADAQQVFNRLKKTHESIGTVWTLTT